MARPTISPDFNRPLTDSEFEALTEVSKGPLKGSIPENDKASLLHLGFIAEGFGGLWLTARGQMRINRGR
jgi:hypothetical protein